MNFDGIYGKSRNIKASEIPFGALPSGGVTKGAFITSLKEDLVLEYTSALQYLQHYAVMKGASFDNIRQHLKEHADEEMAHAVILADRICMLGGEPQAVIHNVAMSADSMAMLSQDLKGEQTAIARYKERVVQALTLGEFGAADELMDILKDEESHAQELITSMGTEPPKVVAEVSVGLEVATPEVPPVEVVPGHPAAEPTYVSGDSLVDQLQKSREQRKTEIISKLANLKKT
jgi:bacterioferritin